jgi:hypothetical protein
VPHPADSLRAALGEHPDTREAARLFDYASSICGTGAVRVAAPGPACAHCGFNPDAPFGETSCPFSTLYWDFLLRFGSRLEHHPRFALQLGALARLSPGDRAMLRQRAMAIRLNNGLRPAADDIRPLA